jgi:hypothetical protein
MLGAIIAGSRRLKGHWGSRGDIEIEYLNVIIIYIVLLQAVEASGGVVKQRVGSH